jgi:hypothetical protein
VYDIVGILILRKPHWLSSTTQSVKTKSVKTTCLNITLGCQHPTNVMTYTTAAKTDKPTDWKALWIIFGDGTFSKKNDIMGVTCLSTGQVGGGSVD